MRKVGIVRSQRRVVETEPVEVWQIAQGKNRVEMPFRPGAIVVPQSHTPANGERFHSQAGESTEGTDPFRMPDRKSFQFRQRLKEFPFGIFQGCGIQSQRFDRLEFADPLIIRRAERCLPSRHHPVGRAGSILVDGNALVEVFPTLARCRSIQ